MVQCNSPLTTRPILYTDVVKALGGQVLRDDLWAVTTEELNAQEKERLDLRATIRSIAQRVHQAHHRDMPGTFETCERATCEDAAAKVR